MRKIFVLASSLLFSAIVFAKEGQNVSGTISDVNNKPVAGATVQVLNTGINVVAKDNGAYELKNIASGKYVVVFTAQNFAVTDTAIVIRDKDLQLNIVMQPVANELDAVVVTAEKKEQLLQQSPSSVTAFNARQVQNMRIWQSENLSGLVPNMFSNNSGDQRNVTSIRGVVTTSYDPSVVTYIDGVSQFSLDTYIDQLFGVDHIEILRGPQGTLYGRNAMGGVINIVTKQPVDQTKAAAEINIGNHGQQRYTAGFTTPLIKQHLYFGASFLYDARDGFYTNEYNNTSFDKQSSFGGNYFLKYVSNNHWSAVLNVKHLDNRNNGAFPLVNGVSDAFDNPYKLNQNATAKMFDNTINASLSVQHSGDKIHFVSQSAWQKNYRYYNAPLDGDFSPLDAVSIINNYGKDWNNVKVFTQEFRLSSAAGSTSPLDWTAGAYFFAQKSPVKQATYFGADAAAVGSPDTDFSVINTTTAKNNGIAFFGQLQYALSDKFSLIGGLRYDYENKKLSVMGEYDKPGVGSFVTLPDTSATVNFSALSPKLGLSFKASAATQLYALYSRGYRTGGLTQLSSDPSTPPLFPYKPEYSNNIEAGTKNELFSKRLRLNVALFYTLVRDAQVPTLILPDAITVTKNTGKLDSKGVELEIAGNPVKGLELMYNLGYTNAKYQSLKVSIYGNETDLKGSKQIYTPDVTSMLAAQYTLPLNTQNNVQLIIRGEWQYTGTVYFDLANTISQAPYQLLNARAGISTKHVDVFAWGRNITDKHYIAYAYDFGAVHLANPATFGATVALKL